MSEVVKNANRTEITYALGKRSLIVSDGALVEGLGPRPVPLQLVAAMLGTFKRLSKKPPVGKIFTGVSMNKLELREVPLPKVFKRSVLIHGRAAYDEKGKLIHVAAGLMEPQRFTVHIDDVPLIEHILKNYAKDFAKN